MGTFYTFTTPLLTKKEDIEKAEKELEEFKSLESYFEYFKMTTDGGSVWFCGRFKNSIGGPVEFAIIDTELAWISDEHTAGNNLLVQSADTLPDFLYQDEHGQIMTGTHGDANVTKEWNAWKEINCR